MQRRKCQAAGFLIILILFLHGCLTSPEPDLFSEYPITLVNTIKPATPTSVTLTPDWTPTITPSNTPWPSDTPRPTYGPKFSPTATQAPDIVVSQLLGEGQAEIKTQLAFVSRVDDQLDIFLISEQNPEPENFIHSGFNDIYPTWSLNGKSLAYLRTGSDLQTYWRDPKTDLFLVQNLVHTNLTANRNLFIPELVWAPNNNYIAFTGKERDPPPLKDASLDIYIANIDTQQSTRILNANGVGCRSLSWSPDNWELVSRCRGSMVIGLVIDDRSGENPWFTDFIPADLCQWLPSGERIMVFNMGARLSSIDAEYMRQRDDQIYPEIKYWDNQLEALGYQIKNIRAMEWYPKDDNLFMTQSDDLIQVVDLNRGEVVSILGQFSSPPVEDWFYRPDKDLTGQITWGPEGEQIAFAFFDGHDAEIGIVNLRTKEYSQITNNLVDDLMPAWRPALMDPSP